MPDFRAFVSTVCYAIKVQENLNNKQFNLKVKLIINLNNQINNDDVIFIALEIDLEKVGNEYPEFPWELAYAVINSTATQGFW